MKLNESITVMVVVNVRVLWTQFRQTNDDTGSNINLNKLKLKLN